MVEATGDDDGLGGWDALLIENLWWLAHGYYVGFGWIAAACVSSPDIGGFIKEIFTDDSISKIDDRQGEVGG